MAYPKQLIQDGEEVALDLNPHWWFFIEHILVGLGMLGLLAIVVSINNSVTSSMWAIGAVVFAIWVAARYADWRNTHFVVTDRRVIYRSGFLSKHGVEIPLDRVTNINFSQGPLERLIGAGDLDIESAGREGTSHFDDVRHPDMVQQELYRQMDRREHRTTERQAAALAGAMGADAGRAAADDPVEQIRKLAELRDIGAITVEEFEAKKAELLRRM